YAATAVVPDRRELLLAVRDLADRLPFGLQRRLDLARRRLDDLTARRVVRVPLDRVREHERRLDGWADRLARAGKVRLDRCRERADGTAARLAAVSPLNVLARGYSVTQTEAGAVVRDAARLRPGDRLRTRLHRGRVVARV